MEVIMKLTLSFLFFVIALFGCGTATQPAGHEADATLMTMDGSLVSEAKYSQNGLVPFKFQLTVPDYIPIPSHLFELVVANGDGELLREYVEVVEGKIARTYTFAEGEYLLTVNVYEAPYLLEEPTASSERRPTRLAYTGSAKVTIQLGFIAPVSIMLSPVPVEPSVTRFVVELPAADPFFLQTMVLTLGSRWHILDESGSEELEVVCPMSDTQDTAFIDCPPFPYEVVELKIDHAAGKATGSLLWTHGTMDMTISVTAYDGNGNDAFIGTKVVRMYNGKPSVRFSASELQALSGGVDVKVSFPRDPIIILD